MRIGIDIRELETGKKTGIGRILLGFLNYVSLNDTVNEYILFGNQKTDCSFGASSLKFKIIPEKITFFWDQVKLPVAISRQKVEVFFSPYFKAPLFSPCNFVTAIHDLTPLRTQGTALAGFYYKFWGRLCAKFAKNVITLSEHSKQDLLNVLRIDKDKLKIVYPAVNNIFFDPVSEETVNRVEQNYRIKSKFIFWVGALKPSKNLLGLIKAYKMLPNGIKNEYELVIAGKGNKYLEVLKDSANKLGIKEKVLFPGFIHDNDLPALYHGAEVFVMPSLHEGFGLPVLEAMACKTPVVASNVTSIPEVTGDAAVLVDPNDINQLSKAMEKVLSNETLRNNLIAKGTERAKKFSVEKMACKILDVLNEVGRNG
ncbi:glycosyltransferase family 4 protein [bacterium]|nr:glycosyltransferase family 4 protein [bacterium]